MLCRPASIAPSVGVVADFDHAVVTAHGADRLQHAVFAQAGDELRVQA